MKAARTKPGPWVASALGDLRLPLDARGLMGLAEARRRVRGAKVFENGKSHVIPGQLSQPDDGDFLWAALLSLSDTAEFVREASRLKWKSSPRGMDNLSAYERFGDGILPWLALFIDAKGELASSPRCVIPCLAAMGTKDALEQLLRIRPSARDNVREVAREFLRSHGKKAWRALAELAAADNAASRALLLAEAKRAPGATKTAVTRAVGAAKARLVLSGESAARALGDAGILEILDAAATSTNDTPLQWPYLGASVGHFEPHAMRLVAARSKKGDDWGVLFEVVQGDVLEGPGDTIRWPATIQQYRYGTRVPTGGRYLEDARPIGMHRVLPKGVVAGTSRGVPRSVAGTRVVGPKGTKPLVLTDALAAKLALGRACSRSIEDWPSIIAVRARLGADPAVFWADARALAKKVLGIREPVIVVDSHSFEHVSGPAFGSNAKDRRLPSATSTFRSVASAIVKRDPKAFHAGTPNVDWRGQLASHGRPSRAK